MSHQVLCQEQFSGVKEDPEEASVGSPTLRDEIPEQEDDDIGAEGKRMSLGPESQA